MTDFTGGRTLKLFLVDGNPTGIITAELGNWSGKAVVAPRTSLPDLVQRSEAKQTGVYLLSGQDPHDDRTLVYVGEGDSINSRIKYHDSDDDKQFFDRVCLVVSKDENLTKAHGRYLESRIIQKIGDAGRATLANGTAPKFEGLPESDKADMEGFLRQIEVLLPILGFDYLRTVTRQQAVSLEHSDTFFELEAGAAKATGKEVGGEFIVLEGSTANRKEVPSARQSLIRQRLSLLESGILIEGEEDDLLVFSADYAFNSSSGAASVIYGGNLSGPSLWRRAGDQMTYGEWRRNEFAATGHG